MTPEFIWRMYYENKLPLSAATLLLRNHGMHELTAIQFLFEQTMNVLKELNRRPSYETVWTA